MELAIAWFNPPSLILPGFSHGPEMSMLIGTVRVLRKAIARSRKTLGQRNGGPGGAERVRRPQADALSSPPPESHRSILPRSAFGLIGLGR